MLQGKNLLLLCLPRYITAVWSDNEVLRLKAPDSKANRRDLFGTSVAVSSELAVIGAYSDDDAGSQSGSAFVYKLSDLSVKQIIASDAAEGNRFGFSVAVSNEVIAIGALLDDSTGAVFLYDSTSYEEINKLEASDGVSGDEFGCALSLLTSSRGTPILLVGARYTADNGLVSGSAYVYRNWNEEVKLLASDGARGDHFGEAVALNEIESNLIAVIGAHYDDDAGLSSGSAYIFLSQDDGISWTQVQKIAASDASSGDNFGIACAAYGSYILIGAPSKDVHDITNSIDTGVAYLFKTTDQGLSYSQIAEITTPGLGADDKFGQSVSLSSGSNGYDEEILFVTIGAPASDDNDGAVYLYNKSLVDDEGSWDSATEKLSPSEYARSYFGAALSATSDLLLVGASYQLDNFNGSAFLYDDSAPGIAGTTTSSKKKKKSKDDNVALVVGLIITLLVLFCCCCGCIIAFFFMKREKEKNDDYDDLHGLELDGGENSVVHGAWDDDNLQINRNDEMEEIPIV